MSNALQEFNLTNSPYEDPAGQIPDESVENQLSTGDPTLDAYFEQKWGQTSRVEEKADRSQVWDFFGQALWGAADTASANTLSIGALTETGRGLRTLASLDTYDDSPDFDWHRDMSVSGKIGYSIGAAAGFLVPLGWWTRGAGVVSRGVFNVGSKVAAKGAGEVTERSLNYLGRARANRIVGDLTAEYNEKLASNALMQTLKTGDDRFMANLTNLADDVLLSNANNPRKWYGFGFNRKSLIRGNTRAIQEGSQELAYNLKNGYLRKHFKDVADNELDDLAGALLGKALEHSPHNVHKVLSMTAAHFGFKGVPGKILAGMVSHGTMGFTYHLAAAGVQNLAYGGVNALGEVDQSMLKADKDGFYKHILGHGSRGNIGAIIEDARKHAYVWAGLQLTSPILGGISGGRRRDIKAWMKATVGRLRPVKKMSDEKAIAELALLDDTMKLYGNGNSLSMFDFSGKHLTSRDWVETFLTNPEKYGKIAKDILQSARKEFYNINTKQVWSDLAKDMLFSSPRMFAGAMVMSAPQIADYYKRGGEGLPFQAFGESTPEQLANIAIGMVLTRHGRTFYDPTKAPRKNFIYKFDPIKQSYTADIKRTQAVQTGLEMLNVRVRQPNVSTDTNEAQRVIASELQKTGPFKEVFDKVADYFVNKVTDVPGSSPIDKAYLAYLNATGKKFDANRRLELNNAIEILRTFKDLGVESGYDIRNVTPEEAHAIVKELNSIRGVRESKGSIDIWISNAITEALNTSATKHKDIRQNFVREIQQLLGLQTGDPDARTGILPITKYDLTSLLGQVSIQNGTRSIIREIIQEYDRVIDQAGKDGYIKEEFSDRGPIKLTPEIINGIAEIHKTYVLRENQRVGGKDTMIEDKYILSNPILSGSYRLIRERDQINNLLSIFTPEGFAKLDHTIAPETVDVLRRAMADLSFKDQVNIIGDIKEGDAEYVINAYQRLKAIHDLKNPSSGGQRRDIDINVISGAIEKFQSVFNPGGKNKMNDIFTSDVFLQKVVNKSFDHFIKSLTINEADFTHSTIQAVQHFLNGTVDMLAVGEIQPNGVFAKRGRGGFKLPSGESLEKVLQAAIKDPQMQKELSEILGFYKDFESILRGSGGTIEFETNVVEIRKLMEEFGGPEKLMHFLKQGKMVSEKGNIIDTIQEQGRIENLSNKSVEVKDNIESINATPELDATLRGQLINDFKQLTTSIRSVGNLLRMARLTRNYKLLASLGGVDKKLANAVEDIDLFLGINTSKSGIVNLSYQQKLLDIVKRTNELLQQQHGKIDNLNLETFLKSEMRKYNNKLSDQIDQMEVGTTPARFESKYKINLNDLQIDTPVDIIRRNGITSDIGSKELRNLIANIYGSALSSASKDFDLARSEGRERQYTENLLTDVTQLISNKIFKKSVLSITYDGGLLKVRESYTLADPRLGVDGLANFGILQPQTFFKLSDSYFVIRDGKKVSTAALSEKERLEFEAGLSNGTLKLEYDYERDYLSNNMRKDLDQIMGNYAESTPLLKVNLGEGQVLLVDKIAAQESVMREFGENGKMYNEMVKMGLDQATIDNYVRRFSTEMNDAELGSAIQVAYQILNVPHVLKNPQSNAETMKRLKNRNLTKGDSGKSLTPDYIKFLQEVYTFGENSGSKLHKYMAESYRLLEKNNKKIRQLTIKDEVATSIFSTKKIAEMIFGKEYSGEELSKLIQNVPEASAVNAATFVTRQEFLLHLGTMGLRPEWVQMDKDGRVTGFNLGAIKPKGVHVEVGNNGNMTVFYNKTAFFYDPAIGKALEKQALDHVTFESGVKIGEVYEGGKRVSKKVEPEPAANYNADSDINYQKIIVDMISKYGSQKENIVELPYSTYTVTNASREHLASVGSNLGVHLPRTSEIDVWMNLGGQTREFKELLHKMVNNEYSMTDILSKIAGQNVDGDPMLSRMPYEHMIKEGGLVTDSYIGDVAVDKLFTYFYKNGKIASSEVANSSYNVMAPDINTPIKKMSLPERIDGRQIKYGHSEMPVYEGNQKFSWHGYNNRDMSKSIENDTQSIGSLINIKYNGKDKKADALFLPNLQGGVDVFVNGFRIRDGKIIDMQTGKESKALEVPQLDAILKSYDAMVKDLIGNPSKPGQEGWAVKNGEWKTNSQVFEYLQAKHTDFWLGRLDVRQPRNSMNDLVITKITGISDKRSGNQTKINIVDAVKTQDADHDFDKSSSYKSAPPGLWAAAAENAGYQLSSEPTDWAAQLVKKLELDIQNGNMGNDQVSRWLNVKGNSDLMRGQFVKMHNTFSYFLNAFRRGMHGNSDGVLMQYQGADNNVMSVKVKSDARYRMVVDNIADLVKTFIDNYNYPPGTEMMTKLREAILFGDHSSKMEGLFEVYNETKGRQHDRYIGEKEVDVREMITRRFISPLNQYLRFNKGEAVTEEAGGSGLKLKDIYYGKKELDYAFSSGMELRPSSQSKLQSGRLVKDFDISMGIKQLREYIDKETNNPFDNMMRELSVAYEGVLNPTQRNVSTVEGLLARAEANILTERATGIDAFMKVKDNLWDYVKKDHDYAQLTQFENRIKQLEDSRAYYASRKDAYNLDKTQQKLEFYSELKADIEARIAGEINFLNKRFVRQPRKEGFDENKFIATGQAVVIWDKSGKIKEVIQPGRANQKKILNSDTMIYNGRRFELIDHKQQQALRAKHLAFNSLPEDYTNNQRIDMRLDYTGIIEPSFRQLKDDIAMQRTQLANKAIDPATYSIRTRKLLDDYLNQTAPGGRGIDSALMRKAFIWRLLTPEMDLSIVSYSKDHEKGSIYHDKFYDNSALTKMVHGYLFDIMKGDSFQGGAVSRAEAKELLSEISKRQTLAHLGVTRRDVDVVLPGDFGTNFYSNSGIPTEMKISRDAIIASRGNYQAEEALHMINDFIHGNRVLSPVDMYRLADRVAKTNDKGLTVESVIESYGIGVSLNAGARAIVPERTSSPSDWVKELKEQFKGGCR